MVRALKKLGVKIKFQDNSAVVFGSGGVFNKNHQKLYCGNAGTTFRFLSGLLTLNKGEVILDGSKRMRERPIANLASAIQQLGVNVKTNRGFPPLTIRGGVITGKIIKINASESSQFLSSILMISPFIRNGVTIQVEGNLTSKPYVDLTLDLMKRFGVEVINVDYKKFQIDRGQTYKPTEITIEADASSASYFLASAAITGKTIVIDGIGKKSLQADVIFVDALKKMGCDVIKENSSIKLKGRQLKGITIDMNSSPDIVQTLAVTACFAKGKTTIRNVRNLRIKETDRLKALSNELKKIGAEINELEDGLEITPGKIRPVKISTYNDHRMAMSFAVASLRIPGLEIRNPYCVKKSFPDFWIEFNKLKSAFKI